MAAAIFGLVDLLSLRGTPLLGTATKHMLINLTVVALYVINAWLRHRNPADLGLPMTLSLIAVLMLVVSGWLGGKMVYECGVGVNSRIP